MAVTGAAQIRLRRKILLLAWPAIFEMVLHMMVGIVDTAMVGRLGPQELAAVGLGSRILFSVIFVFAALGTGAAAMVARTVGGGEREEAGRVAAQAIMLAFLAGGILALVGFSLSGPFFQLLGVEPAVLRLGQGYLQIVMLPVPLMLPLFVSNAILRGAGQTRMPLVVALVANGVNILVDYLLIFGWGGLPALGLQGAAWGTASAQMIGFLLVMGILLGRTSPLPVGGWIFRSWDWELVKRILRLSLPAGMEEGVYSLGEILFTFMVARLGTVAFAAHQVAVTVESLSFMPGYGFAIATATTVGQSLGRQGMEEAKEGGRQGTRLALMVMGTIGLLFLLFPRVLVGLFAPGQGDVIALGAICIMIGALEQPAVAMEMILSGALRGAGETRRPLLVTSLGIWLVRLPLTYLVVFVWGLPLWAVWMVTVMDWSFRAVLLGFYYRQGRWLQVKV